MARLVVPEAAMKKSTSSSMMNSSVKISGGAENPLVQSELALQTLSNLIKTAEDQDKAKEIMKQWVKSRQS